MPWTAWRCRGRSGVMLRSDRFDSADRQSTTRFRGFELLLLVALLTGPAVADPESTGDRVVARVDGNPITIADCDAYLLIRQTSEKKRPGARQEAREQIIERRLIELFLDGQKRTVPSKEVDRQLARLEQVIRKRGSDPERLFAGMGISRDSLRRELELTLRWSIHCAATIEDSAVRQHFQRHQRQFDGTELEASQIFRKASDEETRDREMVLLNRLAERIKSGEMTFAEAAREHSQSPTSKQGGRIGTFGFRGRMPAEFTSQMFALDSGQVSTPFSTRFGVHLVQVNKVIPGELSLEDARPRVMEELSDQLWQQLVLRQTASHTVERSDFE